MQASPEYRALRKSGALLRNNVNPDDIVTLLFDEELLTDGERDSANNDQLIATKRMEKVYSALERRVRVSPEPFHKFVRILIGVPALKPVAEQLYDLYLKEGETRQEYAAHFEAPVQPTPDGHVAGDGGTRLAAGTANQGTPSGAGGAASQDSLCDTDWFTLANDEHHDDRDAEGHIKCRSDLWPKHKKELRVFFMNPDEILRAWRNSDGDTITKKDILEIANEWHNCAKEVIPKFVLWKKEQSSDIRVKYIVPPDGTGNPRSKVGSRASNISEDEPTMWLQLEPTDEEKEFHQLPPARYKRTIRHEFGHALGLKHEHSHPDAPRLYDKAKLKVYLKRWYYPDWSWAKIESKIESQWASKREGESSEYDDHSVMHYEIPVEIWPEEYVAKPETYPGPRGLPIEISATDKRFIKRKYKEVFGIDEETDEMDTGGEDSGEEDSGGQSGGIAEDSGRAAKKKKRKRSQGENTTPEAKDKKITPEGLNKSMRICIHCSTRNSFHFEDFPEPNTKDLMEMAGVELRAKRKLVGQALGFEVYDLDAINMNHHGDVQMCMLLVFQTWSDREGHTSNYSWKKLAEAICSPLVNRKALLQLMYDRLKAKYN